MISKKKVVENIDKKPIIFTDNLFANKKTILKTKEKKDNLENNKKIEKKVTFNNNVEIIEIEKPKKKKMSIFMQRLLEKQKKNN